MSSTAVLIALRDFVPLEGKAGTVAWVEFPRGLGNCLRVQIRLHHGRAEVPNLAIVLELSPPATPGKIKQVGGQMDGRLAYYPLAPRHAMEHTWSGFAVVPYGHEVTRLGISGAAPETSGEGVIERRVFSPSGQDILVNLSVDTEALPHRASADHVNRLIYGRFDGAEHGISAQMEIFRDLGVPATFYLECGQAALYGDSTICDVGKFIVDRGFDLQLHLHSEILAHAQKWEWTNRYAPALQHLDAHYTRRALEYAMERFRMAAGRSASVFRAGAFQYGPATVLAAGTVGLKALSNYRLDQPQNNTYDFPSGGPPRPFRWLNGLYEFPITISPEPLTGPPEVVWQRIMAKVHHTRTWLVNIVIHSWSLLTRSDEGHQIYTGAALAENLKSIIRLAPVGVRFVSISDVLDLLEAGAVGPCAIMDPGTLSRAK